MSVLDQKKEFILLWRTQKFSVVELSKMFDISRTTAYKFINRYKRNGEVGLEELSRAPRKVANKTPSRIESEIIKLRGKHQRWGAEKLLVLLEDRLPGQQLPKVSTVNLILRRNGLIKERRRRKKVEPQKPIFDPQVPNEVWSADFKGKFRMGNGQYCYPLTIADSCTRYVFAAKGLHAANTKSSKPVFVDVFRRYGLPEQLHTDNGAPFASIQALGRLSKLGVWLMDLGIKPVYSDPAHPEQNGRHERMHRELKGEATRPPGYSLRAQQRKLNAFVKEYNEVRPHSALDLRTPVSVHERSVREYPEKISDWDYPPEYKIRYVCKNGSLRIGRSNWLFVSTALQGKNVGLEEIGNGIHRLYYRQFLLGYLDENQMKVHDITAYQKQLRV
jgi:transposase InsO family protein